MNWLNANAPAIQAIAALASVLVTVALAIITWRYVRLTRDLVETARQISISSGPSARLVSTRGGDDYSR